MIGCSKDFFVKIPQTLSYEGRLDRTVFSIEGCKLSCLDDPLCQAFDYNNKFFMCYLHLVGYMQNLVTGDKAEGVDQYRRITCPASGCVDRFTRVPNTLSYQGKLVESIVTVEGCQVMCLSDRSCHAFDFNKKYNLCFAHTNAYIDLLVAPVEDVDQYRREFCFEPVVSVPPQSQCIDRFEEFIGRHSFAGAEQSNVRSKTHCEVICRQTPWCEALDWDLRFKLCFLHGQGFVPRKTSLVNQYVRIRCSEPDKDCVSDYFTEHKATMSYFGEAQNVNTREACERLCLEKDDCGAYDWDSKYWPQCFLHNYSYLTALFTNADDSVTQYRRVKCQNNK